MFFLDLLVSLLALVGVAALILVVLLSRPLKSPPPLGSILDGALRIEADGLPELSRFQARDGTWLASRRYAPAAGASGRIVVLAHGSAGGSAQMNAIARGLANAGMEAVAVDFRGHGASGTRGDVAYAGQLDDDLADLIEDLRRRSPGAKFAFVGHSSGGGYGLRVASGPLGGAFERFVLLAPYLGYRAPTTRPAEGAGLWAAADVPRIIAISMLKSSRRRLAAIAARAGLRDRPGRKEIRDRPIHVSPDDELRRARRLAGRISRGQGAGRRDRRR